MTTRREFLHYCKLGMIGSAFSPVVVPALTRALEKAAAGKPPVIWLQGSCCSGCSVSLLNSVETPVFELLNKIISLSYHPTIMEDASENAISRMEAIAGRNKGKYILIIEGAVPQGDNGLFCTVGIKDGREITMSEMAAQLAENAGAIAAVGTCASYGGIPAAEPNPSAASSVEEFLGRSVINIPGCPPHPDWIIGTLAHLIMYGAPELDDYNRPLMFFENNIHEHCPNLADFDDDKLAEEFGEDTCLGMLGCKGPMTNADCPTRKWNNKNNWCIGARSVCFGCTESGFPDDMSPFYSM